MNLKKILAILLLSTASNYSFSQNLTANDIIKKIKNQVTCDWESETVDNFKGGDPEVEVTGIATTFMATLEVLKKAKSKGLNMIITHEPTFYNHFDHLDTYGNDPIISEKLKFIKENNLTVFRFHDHIHRTNPDGIYKGVVNQLGWEFYEVHQRPYIYKMPEIKLKRLAEQLKRVFQTNTIRIVGNPEMVLTNVALVLGASGSKAQIQSLQREDVDVEIIGETHEWETVEYVRDAQSLGKNKALILVGHANSEEAGMDYCSHWLKTFLPDLAIEFIPAGDPFWTPK